MSTHTYTYVHTHLHAAHTCTQAHTHTHTCTHIHVQRHTQKLIINVYKDFLTITKKSIYMFQNLRKNSLKEMSLRACKIFLLRNINNYFNIP